MKKDKTCGNSIKRIIASREISKGKLLRSLLTGFAVPFLLFICASFNVYFSNHEELGFGFSDFAPIFLLLSAVAFTGVTLLLLLTKKWLHNFIFALFSGLVICAYAQTLLTTLTFKGLPGDGNVLRASKGQIIINLILWIVLFAAILWFCVISKKAKRGRKIMCFLMCLVVVMQSASLLPSAIGFVKNTDSNETQMYLTTENMFEVSEKKNVIVFILDRFDINYYNNLIKASPETADALDGFTLYNDNISKYPRTFPAITYLLTGEEFDFHTQNSTEYTNTAFERSAFMKDLEDNNYSINLYIPHYSAYSKNTKFSDAVANTSPVKEHKVISPLNFTKKMFMLASYFWLPDMLKSQTISSTSFNNSILFEGTPPKYSIDNSSDAEVFAQFNNTGLSVQSNKNSFMFLHLRGCHAPFTIDENGVFKGENAVNSLQQTKGCFKFITEYLNELKTLGLYDDATIIITGDHGALDSDLLLYSKPILTTLLVKESGKSGTPLAVNSAPVSQDNFLATIVKSAGIQTEYDYGRACNEISEDETVVRTHYFQLLKRGLTKEEKNFTYTITGPASDFSNWELSSGDTK